MTRALPTLIVVLAACSGAGPSGPPGPCTVNCPPVIDAALRITVEFDAASRGLEPSGFRLQDVTRIDLVVQGGSGTPKTVSITPPQDAAFLDVIAGAYTISATGYSSDLILFTASSSVTVAKGDTANVRLPMVAALGTVDFEIDGKVAGTIDAVAGQNVPFVVRVRNQQGRPVPNSSVVVRTIGGFGVISFTGTNATDALGEARGSVRAPQSGAMSGFSLLVDNRPITVPTDLKVQFATAVDASKSDIAELDRTFVTADGVETAEFGVVVRNAEGELLPDVPVVAISSRNSGVDSNVDRIELAAGYTTGKTDAFGRFRFRVTSTTSSFMELDSQGRLYSKSDAGRVFHPATIRVLADGVQVDQRDLTFNSVVNPTGANFVISPQFVTADGLSSALITVDVRELPNFGADPAVGVFVEIANAFNEAQNYDLDLRPEPGFDGFRTNAQGQWKGRIRSSNRVDLFLFVKADGRALTLNPRSVFFR